MKVLSCYLPACCAEAAGNHARWLVTLERFRDQGRVCGDTMEEVRKRTGKSRERAWSPTLNCLSER
jgi:hypothetical protein